jgi:inorganic triphosphatase YgiF
MEIEAKYVVTSEALSVVAGLDRLGPYLLRAEPVAEQQQNRYFDTEDRRLGQARYGLRVREVNGRFLVTLKGPSEVSEGLHRRAEYEFPHSDPDPHSWPAGPARELALALVGPAPLMPTVTVLTTREVIFADYQGQAVAELCLDRGVLYAGGRSEPFTELEIELLPGGAESDLAALAEALRQHIDIRPEPRSKLRRGLALLEEV